MRALFIGGTGTISGAVVRLAMARGWDVTLLKRTEKDVPAGAEWLQADIRDAARVETLLAGRRFDAVAQFVGFTPGDVRRDMALFAGKTDQYLFISSASAYQKPVALLPITESTPLVNPYWQYSRDKAACEDALLAGHRDGGFPVTIVRPSHTYHDQKLPVCLHGAKGGWQTLARMRDGKPVLLPGDGTGLWTMTHADDFAKGFVGLMGNPRALGQTVHITSDEALTWRQIYEILARAVGVPLRAVCVPSEFLAAHSGPYDFTGALLGDKAANVLFDNTKIKRLAPDFRCDVTMGAGLRRCADWALSHPEAQVPDPEFDAWCDKMAAAMEAAAAFAER